MNDIFTQQPDIVTAGTDFVISLMAAVFGYMTVRRHTDRNAVCNMSILMFAAVFAAGIAGAVLHGLTAVSESFAAEQVIRSFTAACLGGIAVPVVYICMYCASGRLHAARLGRAALILWVAFCNGCGSVCCRRKQGFRTCIYLCRSLHSVCRRKRNLLCFIGKGKRDDISSDMYCRGGSRTCSSESACRGEST